MGSVPALGMLVAAAPMRRRNGFRGVHELLSGTRVVCLPWTKKRRVFRSRPSDHPLLQPNGLPDRVGSFRIQGALHWTTELRILVGQDSALGRRVWIYLRPLSSPALNATRRGINRPTRLRWLACGKHMVEGQWDAFIAPAGCPLSEIIKNEARLFWRDARPLVEQLSDEFAAACRDKTLPSSLTVDRVWLQANGRIQLLDTSLDDLGDASNCSDNSRQEAALLLLRQVVELTLEGRTRSAEKRPAPIRAPVPKHAAPLLNRLLLGNKSPFGTVEQFREELAATRDQPAEINPAERAGHLALLSAALFFPLLFMFTVPFLYTVLLRGLGILLLNSEIREEQRILSNLQDGMQRDFLFSLAAAGPVRQGLRVGAASDRQVSGSVCWNRESRETAPVNTICIDPLDGCRLAWSEPLRRPPVH